MSNLRDRISSFFIFNSTFGPEEGEELKRILFYYPSQVDEDSRKNHVGLCEAIVKFMLNFTQNSCEEMISEKKKTIFYQCEPDYYMVMVVQNDAPGATSNELKGEKMPIEVIKQMLSTAYRMFRLFNGKFSQISIEHIYQKCEMFFTPYLSEMGFKDNITDVIDGIQYLHMDKSLFYKIVCLIDTLDIEYPNFKCVAFLYNEKLMWNNLSTENLFIVYKYLVCRLLPRQVEKELRGGAVTSAQLHGRYISPSGGVTKEEDIKCIYRVHLQGESPEICKFIVYRAYSLTICFTIKDDIELQVENFRSFDAFIGPQLSTLSPLVVEKPPAAVPPSSMTDVKYVFFNRLNLAFRSSLDTNKLVATSLNKPEVLKIISEIHNDKERLGPNGETIVKITDDYWIAGKVSNEREFYAVIQQKNANLKEISDEVRRICDVHMKDIFFCPK